MTFLKHALATILNIFASGPARGGVILMYHSVGRNDKFSTVTPEAFAEQLQQLADKKYAVIPLRDMVEWVRDGGGLAGTVSLTFDDGYLDFYETVFPLLKQYGFHATLFVPTGAIGETLIVSRGADTFQVVNETQIKEMVASGLVDCMPHSVSHTKLHGLPLEEAVKEIEGSRQAIEAITGKPGDIFAYPSGRHTPELVDHLQRSGTWLGAVSVEPGHVGPDTDRFILPRNSVDSATTGPFFSLMLSRALPLYLKVKNILTK